MADENTKSCDTTESSSEKLPEQVTQSEDLTELEASRVCSPCLKPALPTDPASNAPSLLNGNANIVKSVTSSPFTLNPSKLNPFLKVCSSDDDKTNVTSDLTPKFLPLVVQNGGTKTEASDKPLPSTSHTFVFGQNIQDRVVSDKKCDSSTNGTEESEMLFTSAARESAGTKPLACNKSLSESAREYEESRAIKRRYEEVEIKTGEEGEMNVLQISCKLFTFDKNGGGIWQERGRGVLRLNDQVVEEGQTHSRLVFRTAGSLRVILNTKIRADMTVEVASNKSVRFTAFDGNGEIKVFLVTGTPDDVKQLHRHLVSRVNKEVDYQKHKEVDGDIQTEPSRKKLAANE